MWAIGSSRQCEKDEGLKSGKVSLVSRVRHEVSCQEENEQLKVEFGNWTSTITITNFDGIPTVTAAETKNVDLCPTARGGVGMPEGSRGQWEFRLDQAKGIISIGVGSLAVGIGMPFRKPELRDQVWYYTTDGVLRNAARSVGKRGSAATTGDVITMRLQRSQLFFLVNSTPFAEPIPNVLGAPLFAVIQIHRKGDAVTLTSEKFDEATLMHIKYFSWGMVSKQGEGALVGHDSVKLTRQRSHADSCYTAPDSHGSVVAAVRGAALIEDGAAAEWKIKIDHFQTALYIGLEQTGWVVGEDWWCESAVNHVWYYGSDGSLRTGNHILVKSVLNSQILTLAEQRDKARHKEGEGGRERGGETGEGGTRPLSQPTAGATRNEEILGFGVTRKDIEQAERMELDRINNERLLCTPFVPALRPGDELTLKLVNRTLSVVLNDKPVEGQIPGVHGKVRLGVQFEDDGDAVTILPLVTSHPGHA